MLRNAAIDDFDLILPLLQLRHREGRFGSFSLYEVRNQFDLILAGHGVIGIIQNADGVAEATVGLVVCRFWWSTDPHIEDQWFFVHPDFRRSDHAKSLMTFAKDFSNRARLPLYTMQEETPDTAPKMRLLERNLTRAGAVFRHEPQHV